MSTVCREVRRADDGGGTPHPVHPGKGAAARSPGPLAVPSPRHTPPREPNPTPTRSLQLSRGATTRPGVRRADGAPVRVGMHAPDTGRSKNPPNGIYPYSLAEAFTQTLKRVSKPLVPPVMHRLTSTADMNDVSLRRYAFNCLPFLCCVKISCDTRGLSAANLLCARGAETR